VAHREGSLPFLVDPITNETTYHRNVSGVCDDPTVVSTFIEIAEGIKRNARMKGVLVNVQLAPMGVICLLHPVNNTEDLADGKFLDSSSVYGLDLFQDPFMKFIAKSSITKETVGIAGPVQLSQCPGCDPFFIARLPIVDPRNNIPVQGINYPRWGFATALIAWDTLINQSDISQTFQHKGFHFQLTRTDTIQNQVTGQYERNVAVLAETDGFGRDGRFDRFVEERLQTTNNEWVMTVQYDKTSIAIVSIVVSVIVICFALFISLLVYTVLWQKNLHAGMKADTLTQQAKVDTERNMTAYFAHELRNPLSALDNALTTVADEKLPPATKELIDGMQLCSSFMSSIMNNLLDVRKIEEGKMKIREYAMSLETLIENTHTMLKMSLRPGVNFVTRSDLPEDRKWVMGDSHRLQQVLANVTTNAIKYTLEGSVTLAVAWEGDMVKLECIDTGPGIPKSEQAKLFERFVQRGGAPGTGLGLNIAKQIVTMMGGSICFKSDPTVRPGTTCQILIPMELCEQPGDESSKMSTENKPIEEAIRVLIIDDIRMNRSMLQRRINKAIAPNAICTMAETGEEALEICQEQEFDFIVCDQYMEEAGGVLVGTDVIIALRRNKNESFIIGCSGNDLHEKFYEAGANTVWGKPMPKNADIIAQWRNAMFR